MSGSGPPSGLCRADPCCRESNEVTKSRGRDRPSLRKITAKSKTRNPYSKYLPGWKPAESGDAALRRVQSIVEHEGKRRAQSGAGVRLKGDRQNVLLRFDCAYRHKRETLLRYSSIARLKVETGV